MTRRFLQREGVNYFEAFTPVVPNELLLLVVKKCISKGWQVSHAVISTSFLNGDMNGKLYVSIDKVVYKLRKCLYELRLYLRF